MNGNKAAQTGPSHTFSCKGAFRPFETIAIHAVTGRSRRWAGLKRSTYERVVSARLRSSGEDKGCVKIGSSKKADGVNLQEQKVGQRGYPPVGATANLPTARAEGKMWGAHRRRGASITYPRRLRRAGGRSTLLIELHLQMNFSSALH